MTQRMKRKQKLNREFVIINVYGNVDSMTQKRKRRQQLPNAGTAPSQKAVKIQ